MAGHGGHISLIDVKGDTAFIRLEGGCQGCGMADATLKQGAEVEIKSAVPGDCRFDFDLSTLFKGRVCHAAALASALKANKRRIPLDIDKRDVTTMASHGGVDLFIQDNLDCLSNRGI